MDAKTVNRDANENRFRQKMIDKIEGIVGALTSLPYNEISTEDLQKLYYAVCEYGTD